MAYLLVLVFFLLYSCRGVGVISVLALQPGELKDRSGRTVVAVQEAIGAVKAWEGDTSAIDRARRVSGMHL